MQRLMPRLMALPAKYINDNAAEPGAPHLDNAAPPAFTASFSQAGTINSERKSYYVSFMGKSF